MLAKIQELLNSLSSMFASTPQFVTGQIGGHSVAVTNGAIYRATSLTQSVEGTFRAVANGATYGLNPVLATAELKLPAGTTNPSVCMTSNRTVRLVAASKNGGQFTYKWDPTVVPGIVQRAGFGIPNGSGTPQYFLGFRREAGQWYQELRDPVFPGGELLFPISAAIAATGIDPTAGFIIGTVIGDGLIVTNSLSSVNNVLFAVSGNAATAYAPNYYPWRYMIQMQASGLVSVDVNMLAKGFAQLSWAGDGYKDPSKTGQVTRSQNSTTPSDFVAFAPRTSSGNQLGFRPGVFRLQSSAAVFAQAWLVPLSAITNGAWSDVPNSPLRVNSTLSSTSLAGGVLVGLSNTDRLATDIGWTADFGESGDQEVALVPSGFVDAQQALLIQVANVSGNSATSTTLGWQNFFTSAS